MGTQKHYESGGCSGLNPKWCFAVVRTPPPEGEAPKCGGWRFPIQPLIIRVACASSSVLMGYLDRDMSLRHQNPLLETKKRRSDQVKYAAFRKKRELFNIPSTIIIALRAWGSLNSPLGCVYLRSKNKEKKKRKKRGRKTERNGCQEDRKRIINIAIASLMFTKAVLHGPLTFEASLSPQIDNYFLS